MTFTTRHSIVIVLLARRKMILVVRIITIPVFINATLFMFSRKVFTNIFRSVHTYAALFFKKKGLIFFIGISIFVSHISYFLLSLSLSFSLVCFRSLSLFTSRSIALSPFLCVCHSFIVMSVFSEKCNFSYRDFYRSFSLCFLLSLSLSHYRSLTPSLFLDMFIPILSIFRQKRD